VPPAVAIASPGNAAGALTINYTPGATTGSITYTPVAGASGMANITVTVTDNGGTPHGGLNSVNPTVTVVGAPGTARPLLPAPALTTTAPSLAYLQTRAATVIDPGVTVTDAGSSTILSATVTIVSNFAPGQDILGFTPNPQNGIFGSFNAATGELDLVGIASPAQYQAALRSVTYQNNSNNPSTPNRAVQFLANDASASNNMRLT